MSESAGSAISREELQLATRNHGMPLEALRYPVTPVGLHYLLVHYDIPIIDPGQWSLTIDGCVDTPAVLSLDQLRQLPPTTRVVTMECAGNGRALLDPRPASQPWLLEAVGTGEWRGVELDAVLESVGVRDEAVELLFTGADRGFEGGVEQVYQRSLRRSDIAAARPLLAYELNGAPLPPQHGFPLRLVVPGWYGMTNVKWLTAITALEAPFTGYQQATAYRLTYAEHEAGAPVTQMLPRSLMVPPGIPDFFTRARTLRAGTCTVTGRAWSGLAPVVSVDVSRDGGQTWSPAMLEDGRAEAGRWVGWQFDWEAPTGEYELCCRATDGSGAVQPLSPSWNRGGYVNNAVHRVHVVVVN